MLNKPYMQTPVYAVNVRYTGAAVIVLSLIFIKTAPEVLAFGFYLPRSVYGYIFVAALTAVLLFYKRQLKKREIAFTKKLTAVAVTVGILGTALGIGGELLRNYAFLAMDSTAMNLSAVSSGSSGSMMSSGFNYYSTAASVMVIISDIFVLAMPLILYIELLVKLRKIKEQ